MIIIEPTKISGLRRSAVAALLCAAIGAAYSPVRVARATAGACASPRFIALEPVVSTPNSSSHHGVAAGDFNEDGKQDLAAVKTFDNEVAIFIGDGTGRFGAATDFAVSKRPGFVAVADFNGDRHLDFVTHNYEEPAGGGGRPGSVSIRLGDGAGGFGPVATFPSGFRQSFFPVNPGPLVVGDWNNDGKPDLAEANQGFFFQTETPQTGRPNVSILTGDGAGNFSAPRTLSAELPGQNDHPLRIAAGDLNGDGNLDLVTAHSHTLSFLPGDGRSNFGPAVTLAPTELESAQHSFFTNVFVEDFDGDGKPDIATGVSTGGNAGAVSVRLGDRAGNFGAASTRTLNDFFSAAMTVADFDADLDPDVVVGPWLLLGDGDGGFETPRNRVPLSGFAVVGDFNGDGRQDLVTGDGFSITILLNTCDPAENPTPTLRLLTRENSARAVALDSVTFTGGPFSVHTAHNFSPDQRTRVTLFAADLELRPGEDASAVSAQAEDAQHRVRPLTVESVRKVPGQDWLTQVTVKLPDELEGAGDVQVSIGLRGAVSNKALITIKAGGASP